jgi:hypothetical protein
MKRNHTTAETVPDVRILKATQCPSLSGKSKLRFELGCGLDNELLIRICGNSGTGYFNDDWVPWSRLGAVLDRHGDKPITSFTLAPLFKGRSANSAGFLLAALKHEGLVQNIEGNQRCYERLDGARFIAQVKALMSPSGTTSKAVKAVKPASSRKAPPKARPAKT